MSTKTNIPYGKQHITKEDVDAVVKALAHDFITQGPTVTDFEKAFAEYVRAPHAVAVANGTCALHVAYLSLGLGPGDWIITTPNTFAATSNAALMCGAEVMMVDIDPVTLNIDLGQVDALIKRESGRKRIVGLSVVDFAGRPNDMIAARALADKHGLWLVEDACHALGATYKSAKGEQVRAGGGALADATIFSFHPVKHLTTGEGGMVTTPHAHLYTRMSKLRAHGVVRDAAELEEKGRPAWYYEVQELGYNYRITDLQCALGLSQLARIEANVARRAQLAQRYYEGLKSAGAACVLPDQGKGEGHAYHLYVVQVDDRDGLYAHLKSKGIHPQVHYVPLYRHPLYKKRYDLSTKDFPNCDRYYSRCLSLPMYHSMTDQEQDCVIREVLDFV